MKPEVNCTWHLNRDCNFNCKYCYVSRLQTLGQKGHGVDIDIEAFRKNKVNWKSVMMSGGEPFIYPHYVELCKKMTELFHIGINTNLSTSNIYDFADTVDPKKVDEIHASFHLGQRKRTDWWKFAEKYKYLEAKGFPITASQVIHPTLASEYIDAFDFLKERGVHLNPKIYEGYHRLRLYPAMYKNKIRKMMINYSEYILPPLLFGNLDWEGKPCSAGYNFMQIQYNGNAFRCQGDKTHLGNLYAGDITTFEETQNCYSKICDCAYEGLQYGYGEPHVHKFPSLKKYTKSAALEYYNMVKRWMK